MSTASRVLAGVTPPPSSLYEYHTKTADQAADQAAEPAADQAAEPAADQAAEPAADQAAEPAADQAAEPAADQAAEQAAEEAAEQLPSCVHKTLTPSFIVKNQAQFQTTD
jgi:hypothetical protein